LAKHHLLINHISSGYLYSNLWLVS